MAKTNKPSRSSNRIKNKHVADGTSYHRTTPTPNHTIDNATSVEMTPNNNSLSTKSYNNKSITCEDNGK